MQTAGSGSPVISSQAAPPKTIPISSVLDPTTTTTSPPSPNTIIASSVPPSLAVAPSLTPPPPITQQQNNNVVSLIDEDEEKRQQRKRKREDNATTVTTTTSNNTNSGVSQTPFGQPVQQHVIYQCDFCQRQPLVDVRYRCTICTEFDLCEDCMAAGNHEGTHPFYRHFIDPVPVIKPTPPAAVIGKSPSISSQQQPVSSSTTTLGNSTSSTPSGSSEVGISSRPPRRSASTKAVGSESSIEKMDDILAKCHVGPLPASHSSTLVASQFLDLYEAGLVAMEQYKRGRVQEQITARIAMALVGIPLRARRGGNFVARHLAQAPDQDTVSGVMSSLIVQLMVLDSERHFHTISATAADGKPIEDLMDLEKIQRSISKGFYFRRVENPESGLNLFQRHVFSIWSNPFESKPVEELAIKFERLSRQAIDEIRDALNISPLQEDTTNGKEDESVTVSSSKVTNSDKKSGGIIKTQVSSSSSTLDNKKKEKDKKRKRKEDEPTTTTTTTTTSAVPMGNNNADEILASSIAPQGYISNTQQQGSAIGARSNQVSSGTAVSSSGGGGSFENESELKIVIKRLREDLDDAHARIDVLIHLLKEKIAYPLIRGLDRAGR